MMETSQPKRRGRPELAPEQRRDTPIGGRTTAARAAKLAALAEQAGLTQLRVLERLIDRAKLPG